MYSINELGIQNKHDAWTVMYNCFCEEFNESFGAYWEKVMRDAVRLMGSRAGNELRCAAENTGINTNLNTLFHEGEICVDDPRVRALESTTSDQERVWEVYSCPLADIWVKEGKSHYGAVYCEEYMHSFMEAYSEKTGQIHLSKKMTCKRDTHCQGAAYLRPANMDPEKRKLCFEQYGYKEIEPDSNSSVLCDKLETKSMLLCICCYEAVTEIFGKDGEAAFSRALRKYSEKIIPEILKHAEDTLNTCDKTFIHNNFPLHIDGSSDDIWKQQHGERAGKLFELLVAGKVREQIGIE